MRIAEILSRKSILNFAYKANNYNFNYIFYLLITIDKRTGSFYFDCYEVEVELPLFLPN